MNYLIEFAKKPRVPNEVVVYGVELGNGSKPLVIQSSVPTNIQDMTPDSMIAYMGRSGRKPIIVMKEPGGSHWVRRGDPFAYHGAQFTVFEVKEIREEGDHKYFNCEKLVEVPLRTNESK